MRETRRVRVPCVASTPQRHDPGDTEQAGSMSTAEATAPGVMGAYKNRVNSRGGYFPREDFPWWPVPAGSFPVVAGFRAKNPVNSRGGSFPREGFPWRPAPVQNPP